MVNEADVGLTLNLLALKMLCVDLSYWMSQRGEMLHHGSVLKKNVEPYFAFFYLKRGVCA